MKMRITTLLSAAMLFAATTAMAIPISGSIDFAGSAIKTTNVPKPGNIGIHFYPGAISLPFNTGDYAGIPIHLVTFKDFTFSPTLFPSPVINLWSFTYNSKTYGFDLDSLTSVTNTSTLLQFIGTGELKITGFDNTPGIWNFTDQGGKSRVSFSATSSNPVPEPGTIFLLGVGLLGVVAYGKRRTNKA